MDFDSPRIWGEQGWPAGPWGHIEIAPGEQTCLLDVEGGVAEIDLSTGRIARTTPSSWSASVRAMSRDRRTTVTRVGATIEVRRDDAPPLVLPLGSTVWPSPDGSLLLVRAPHAAARHREGAVTLHRWSDRAQLRAHAAIARDGSRLLIRHQARLAARLSLTRLVARRARAVGRRPGGRRPAPSARLALGALRFAPLISSPPRLREAVDSTPFDRTSV